MKLLKKDTHSQAQGLGIVSEAALVIQGTHFPT